MKPRMEPNAPSLVMRLDFPDRHRLGRGKIELLEHIREEGSISAGGRAMEMSYRRAWILVDEMNRMFLQPVVTTQRGGSQGGRAVLTPFGEELVSRFRAMESECLAALAPDIDWLLAARRPDTEDANENG